MRVAVHHPFENRIPQFFTCFRTGLLNRDGEQAFEPSFVLARRLIEVISENMKAPEKRPDLAGTDSLSSRSFTLLVDQCSILSCLLGNELFAANADVKTI